MKITARGSAIVFESTLTVEEIKVVAKNRPDALKKYGGDDGKDELFSIGLTSGEGGISPAGARFSKSSFSQEGKATITLVIDSDVDPDKVKDAIVEQYTGAVGYIEELESTVPAIARDIIAAQDALRAKIEF
jgi:hypothetical protein